MLGPVGISGGRTSILEKRIASRATNSARQRDINWPEMEATFQAAGTRAEFLIALQQLHAVSRLRPLLVSDIDEIEEFLSHLSPPPAQEAG